MVPRCSGKPIYALFAASSLNAQLDFFLLSSKIELLSLCFASLECKQTIQSAVVIVFVSRLLILVVDS